MCSDVSDCSPVAGHTAVTSAEGGILDGWRHHAQRPLAVSFEKAASYMYSIKSLTLEPG